jgi:predicted ATP-grasp superfamily ATP-dependent carboligase
LAGKGYTVTAADYVDVPPGERLGFFSKHVSEREVLDDISFCEQIERLCRGDRPVLLPGNRRSLMHIIRNHDRLRAFCDFLVPDEKSLAMADDKETMYQIAKRIGVPVPQTTSLAEHKSVESMADCIRYPCIIKYRNGEKLGLKPAERYTVVQNRDAFIEAYAKMHAVDANPIASDYISGHDIGVAIVMSKDREPLSFICYESLREYPIQGGPTFFLKTVYSKRLLEYSVRLLKEICFCGTAMLDFKGTPDEPYFLEINPRLWGSAAVTHISGCDFFEAYVHGAVGGESALYRNDTAPQYKLHRKTRFTPQSLACFASHMKHSPNKITLLWQYVTSALDPFVRDGLFTLRDPVPYLKYIQNLIQRR